MCESNFHKRYVQLLRASSLAVRGNNNLSKYDAIYLNSDQMGKTRGAIGYAREGAVVSPLY